jgi:hypothetical protein
MKWKLVKTRNVLLTSCFAVSQKVIAFPLIEVELKNTLKNFGDHKPTHVHILYKWMVWRSTYAAYIFFSNPLVSHASWRWNLVEDWSLLLLQYECKYWSTHLRTVNSKEYLGFFQAIQGLSIGSVRGRCNEIFKSKIFMNHLSLCLWLLDFCLKKKLTKISRTFVWSTESTTQSIVCCALLNNVIFNACTLNACDLRACALSAWL